VTHPLYNTTPLHVRLAIESECFWYAYVAVGAMASGFRQAVNSLIARLRRRMDPSFVVEVMSGATAIGFALWMIFGNRGPVPRPVLGDLLGICLLVGTAVIQFHSATVTSSRLHRALGCLAAAGLWSLWIVLIWIKGGFVPVISPLVVLDVCCIVALIAYYVDPTGSTSDG